MIYLPDVNFWLALAFQSHVHHARASAWFDALSQDSCGFCRITQQGFLRLATNPKAFQEEAVTLARAWQLYDVLLTDYRVSFVPEPPEIESLWRDYTKQQTFSPKVWNDAYLAAYAHAARCTLVTFDKAFAQYARLNFRVPD
ncbi:MAG TPA: TA system VapC family ribonuclease toxin [Lacipirellula sp.]